MQCNVIGAHGFNVKSILVWGLICLLMSRNEAYGYEKVIYYGLKRLFYHIFKGLSTEQDDENSQDCVCHSVSHLISIVDLVEVYGCLYSLFYRNYFTEQLTRTLGS